MKAHIYRSTADGKVVFCEQCGLTAFDSEVRTYDRIDKMQAEARKPCPLAPAQPSGDGELPK